MNFNRVHLFRICIAALLFAGSWACGNDAPPKKALPPVAFDVYLKRFAPTPDTAAVYEPGVTNYNMLKGMNDSLLLAYIQPLHASMLLSGKDTVLEPPHLLRHPVPVKGADIAVLQYTSSHAFGALLQKTPKYVAAELFWGDHKEAYIVTYTPQGKLIDALLCRWEQFDNSDSSHYERKTFLRGGNKIEIRQQVESEFPGHYNYRAWCHITPDGHFALDSLRSPDERAVPILDSNETPHLRLVDNYNTLSLELRLDKTWCAIPIDNNATLLQTASLDTMQLNGKGNAEVIIREQRYTMQSYGPVMGGWVTYYDAVFIYDIDSRKQLFRSIPRFGRTDLNNMNELSEYCEFPIDINRKGITVGEAKAKNRKPDHVPGTYVLKGNTYVLLK